MNEQKICREYSAITRQMKALIFSMEHSHCESSNSILPSLTLAQQELEEKYNEHLNELRAYEQL